MAEVKQVYAQEQEVAAEQSEMKGAHLVFHYLTFPLRILLNLTIPNLGEDHVKSWYISLMPLTSALIVVFFNQEFNF